MAGHVAVRGGSGKEHSVLGLGVVHSRSSFSHWVLACLQVTGHQIDGAHVAGLELCETRLASKLGSSCLGIPKCWD